MTHWPRRTTFFAFYTVCPPSGGASAVSYQLARHWPGERVLVQIGNEDGKHEIAPDFRVVTLRYAGSGERWEKLASVPRWIREMTAIAVGERPDTIILEGASWSAYHWRLMSALRRHVPGTNLIYHSHNVEYDLRRQKHSRVVAELTRWFEGQLLKECDVPTSVSNVDAARLEALYGRAAVVLPNGVDAIWLASATPASINAIRARFKLTSETVLFMGSYGYRPNKEAIDFLVNDVFPNVVSCFPNARLLVLGGQIPYERSWLVAPGLVPWEDLPSFIRASVVSAAPIFSGSGTRLKIVESLAAGVPVVATAKGAEGLPIEASSVLFLAESASAFSEALCRLLSRPVEQAKNVASTFDHMRQVFDWTSVVDEFLRAISSDGFADAAAY